MTSTLTAHRWRAWLLACGLAAPAMTLADDAARISRLETEIQQLRAQVDEQARRIQRLEAELARRAGLPAPAPAPASRPRASAPRTDVPAGAGPQPWHSAAAWERVTPGMTEADAIAILGPPTSAESVGALKSLFYRGVPGRGELGGHVNLKDGRVVAVSKPAF